MVVYLNKGNYLFVDVGEAHTFEAFQGLVHEVARRCKHEKLNKVLIDATAVDLKVGIFQRFQLGLEIVRVWGSKFMVACVAKPGVINHMTENTAVNRGARIRAFLTMDEALRWLKIETNSRA